MQTKEQQQVMVINTLYHLCKVINQNDKDGLALIIETAVLLKKVSEIDSNGPTTPQLKALQKIKDIFNKAQTCAASTSIQH